MMLGLLAPVAVHMVAVAVGGVGKAPKPLGDKVEDSSRGPLFWSD